MMTAACAEGDGGPAGRQSAPPTRLGEFVLEGEIGRGGMGAVYLARRASDGKRVALKVLHPGPAASAELVLRFKREAEFMLALQHPNIVTAYDVGVIDGRHYLCMEYVPGGSLKALCDREHRVFPPAALRIMREIARALDYGSRRGLVHRDLKPENILLCQDGTAKLADLGLAILAHREDLRLTAPGTVLGTPFYMSPEQARGGRRVDVRSDIYSLGCTMYHAICGRPPFEGENAIKILQQHLNAPPPRPSEFAPGIDPDIEAVVLRCMEKDPANRFGTSAELIEEIDRVLSKPGPEVRPGAARLPVVSSPATAGKPQACAPGRAAEPSSSRPAPPAGDVRRAVSRPPTLEDRFGFGGSPPPEMPGSRPAGEPRVVPLPPPPSQTARPRPVASLPRQADTHPTQITRMLSRPRVLSFAVVGVALAAVALATAVAILLFS